MDNKQHPFQESDADRLPDVTRSKDHLGEGYRLQQARKRVEDIRGFYGHLVVYLVINLLILTGSMTISHSYGKELFRWPMLITPVFWGIGLAYHYARVFNRIPIFGREWEERQIRKYMEADEKEEEKWKY